ncbi:MAG: anti-anti-sigma factor [Candidatus Zixiibacteriota bacterium]|nr:MAG: anti-anti-sigma factor [candidate division Zixibacteria bacterium]HHI03720.1 anti-sigma factor antagonist [candidate division Zixibacteria bacterium]
MFDIKVDDNKHIILSGRLDASQVDKANSVLNLISESSLIDFADLEYISSAGMGLLLAVHKRLSESGHKLKLRNLNNHINDVFHYAGFDRIFEIE